MRRAHRGAGARQSLVGLLRDDPEVEQLDLGPDARLRQHEQVLGLEVAVHERVLVRDGQRFERSDQQLQHALRCGVGIVHDLTHREAFQKLHGDEAGAALGVHVGVEHIHDARMIELRGDPRFEFETRQRVGRRLIDHFDRGAPTGLQVASDVQHAHAAARERRKQLPAAPKDPRRWPAIAVEPESHVHEASSDESTTNFKPSGMQVCGGDTTGMYTGH